MSILEILFQVVLPSGVIGALSAGLINHFSNKNLDVHVRAMEARKLVYTRVNELFAAFYDTASDEETRSAQDELLKCFREIQIWGSDEVVTCFQDVLFAIDVKNGVSQENRNYSYKKFVIAMRRDVLGATDLKPVDINIHGRIKKAK